MSDQKGDMTLGIPRGIPTGERPLWSGGPDAKRLTTSALHVRKLAVYFVLLLAWRLANVWRDGFSLDVALNVTLTTALLAFVVLAAARLYAAASARSTTYTITNRRIVVRTGIALPISINVPFEQIDSVDVLRDGEGGDVEITLVEGAKVGYVILWPSSKSFNSSKTRPVLRALASVEVPVGVLSDALAAFGESLPFSPLVGNENREEMNSESWQAAASS